MRSVWSSPTTLIVDHWGIVKGDIGIRDGRIVAVGKAGNPDTLDGVAPGLVVGAGTEVIAGEGKSSPPVESTRMSI